MNDVYYFVVFSHRDIRSHTDESVGNVILKNIHPVTWAASPPEIYAKSFLTILHFWAEIPEEVATRTDVNHALVVEDWHDIR